MAEAKTQKEFDPSKLFVGTRLFKDSDANGSPIVDENTGEWKSGIVYVQLFDSKTGENVGNKELKLTRNKYLAWREDFGDLSKEDVISEYFENVSVTDASENDLQREARLSKAETELREKDAEIQRLKDEAARREEVDEGLFVDNVRPEGDPVREGATEEPSNPEQEFSNEEMIAKGADAAGANNVSNPEQSAPNVPEDKFTKVGGNTDKESVTNSRKTDVKPVGADAKTNKAVVKAETTVEETAKK